MIRIGPIGEPRSWVRIDAEWSNRPLRELVFGSENRLDLVVHAIAEEAARTASHERQPDYRKQHREEPKARTGHWRHVSEQPKASFSEEPLHSLSAAQVGWLELSRRPSNLLFALSPQRWFAEFDYLVRASAS